MYGIKNTPKRIGNINVSDAQLTQIVKIQNFTSKNTKQSQPVFFYSDVPGMYMLVDRVNPTRYDLPFIASTKNKRYEMLQDFIDVKPAFIFEDTSRWAVDGVNNRQRLPEIALFINKNYKKIGTIDSTIIYQLHQ